MTKTTRPAPLPKTALTDLARSGLAKHATALGLEYSEAAGAPSYTIPYLDLAGRATGFFRWRYVGPANTLPRDRRGKPQRYGQPKNSGCHFYYAHVGRFRWLKVAKDTSIAICFTEGEKKAAAACLAGLPTIGLGGVDNWTTDKLPIDDFDDIEWRGRTVYIVFDSDIVHKLSVREALRRLADELIRRGAVPYVIDLPAPGGAKKTGLDDFLVRRGSGAKALAALRALPTRSLLIPAACSFADLAAKKLPPPRWVVKDLIPVGLSFLSGHPKTGKSWLAMSLSIAVATGGKALDRYETERGGVLHLALEDPPRRFQDRLRRLLDGAPAPGNAYFYNEWRRVEDHGLTALRRELDARRDTRLVIIDTFAKMRRRSSGNEQLYLLDYEAVEQLKAIADEYRIGIIVIHHDRKSAADDHVMRVSGSTGLTGASDTVLSLRRERGQLDAVLEVTGRDIEEQEIALAMDTRTMRWRALGPADDYRVSRERRQILDALTALGRPVSPSEIADAIGKNRRTVNKLLLVMTAANEVQWLPGAKYQLAGKADGAKAAT